MSVEVTEATFQRDVVERSDELPVVIDFWAPWCGPCRTLTPALERAVGATEGKVSLAKVNVDENPSLSAQFQIQGIPAVKAVKDRQIVAEFVGAQPEAAVRDFIDALLPSEADDAAALGTEEGFREALDLQSDHTGATVGLAHILADRGETGEAVALLQRIPGSDEAARLLAEIELTEAAAEGDEAAAALARGDHREALDLLLERVSTDKDPDARESMVQVFTVLGDDHELTKAYRPKLARALF